MSDSFDNFNEVDKTLSKMNHPSTSRSDKMVILQEANFWFNSLKPDEKAEVFLYMLGRVNNAELS